MPSDPKSTRIDLERFAGITPGPWEPCAHWRQEEDCQCGTRGYIWDVTGELVIAQMGCEEDGAGQVYPYPGEKEAKANAEAIAAVPDLIAEIVQLRAKEDQQAERNAELERAVVWALGAGKAHEPFPASREGQGAYWWRTTLAQKAGLRWDGERYVSALPGKEG